MRNYQLSTINYQLCTAIIAVVFAVGTSILSYDNAHIADLAPRFHWPDETTNHFFASRVARGEPLVVPESRNVEARNLIHPRTANVRADGAIVPGAYLGLPLWYGLIGRMFGERAMLFVTPILAALGLFAFGSLIRRFAGASVAIIATTLLALHPSLWLFTATALLPNVPFVAIALLSFSLLLSRNGYAGRPAAGRDGLSARRKAREAGMDRAEGEGATERLEPEPARWDGEGVRAWEAARPQPLDGWRWFSGGLLLGLALTIRTHELLWALALVAVIFARYWVRWKTSYLLPLTFYLFGLVLPFIPILLLNAQLYGSPFTTGYALLQDGGAAPTEFARSFFPSWLTALVAPFGWHPVEAFTRFWQYMVAPYPWFIALAVVGMGAAFARRAPSPPRPPSRGEGGKQIKISPPPVRRGSEWGRGVIVGTIVMTLWLILYYGSWTIADPLVRETNVLTISYVRYWLPITIVLALWAAVGLRWILDRCAMRWRPHIATLMLLGIAFVSLRMIIADPIEGLLRQRAALAEHRTRARAVIAATEPTAIIVSNRMDKVFFPERAVMYATTEDLRNRTFRERLVALPPFVYWYVTSPPIILQLFVHDGNTQRWIPAVHLESVGRAMPFGEHLYWMNGVQVSDD